MTRGPGDEEAAGASGRGHFRVSHADREQVIAALKAAFIQGRLTKDEFDLRVGQALAARTFAELTALTADLPAVLIQAQQRPRAAQVQARPPVSKMVTASACVMIVAAAVGLLAGIVFTLLSPPVFRSSALVYLPSSVHDISTQVVIATSDPVLAGALRAIDSSESPQMLRSAIQVKNVTPNIIAFTASGTTAAQAERTADAAASSYAAFVNAPARPGPPVQARILTSAKAEGASGPSTVKHWVTDGGLGALAGLLIGAAGAFAFIGVWQNNFRAERTPAD